MSETKWIAGAATSLLTTQLNALADGGISALGTEYDNATNLYLFGDFQLDVDFVSAPTVNLPVALYIVPALDGTNYGFGSASAVWAGYNRGGWSMIASTAQQVLTIQGIPLPPLKFKIQVKNSSGQAMPATGTTVKLVPYRYQSA